MKMTKAALLKSIATLALPAVTMLAFAGPVAAQSSHSADGSVAVAMRVAPSTPSSAASASNVTIVPKTSDRKTSEAGPAYGASPSSRQAVESTVREQLMALAKGDAELAFENLSPQTQRYFAEPRHFMQSVATDAPPIVKTKSFSFVGLEQNGFGATQQVMLTDEDGRSWLAKFEVEQQLAGDWRVKSCVVEAVPGQQA